MAVALLSSLVIPIMIGFIVAAYREWDQSKKDHELVSFKMVGYPPDLDIKRITLALNAISGTFRSKLPYLGGVPTIVFEVSNAYDEAGFTFRILVPWSQDKQFVIDKLQQMIPGLHFEQETYRRRRAWTVVGEWGLKNSGRLLDITTETSPFVSRSLLSSMNQTAHGEVVQLQIVAKPLPRVRKPIYGEARTDTVLKPGEATRDEVNERRDKLDETNYKCVMRIGAIAGTKVRAVHLKDEVKRSLSGYEGADARFRGTVTKLDRTELEDRFNKAAAPRFSWPMQLTLTELGTLLMWPQLDPNIPGLPTVTTPHLPPGTNVPQGPLVIGTASGQPSRKVGITIEDSCKHMQITGPPGVGKTVLMTNVFKQVVAQGCGVVLIEAKGDLFEAALEQVPRERLKDVIILNVGDTYRPLGFNILQQGPTGSVIRELTELYENITGLSSMWGTLAFTNGLHTLALDERSTLPDLYTLLMPQTPEATAWRDEMIAKARDPELINYWKLHLALPESERMNRVRPALDRISMINSRPTLRNILNQSTSSFDLEEVIQNNKILLINASGADDSGAAELMSTFILNAAWGAAQRVHHRGNTPKLPNYLMLDEFASYMKIPVDTEMMLRMSRSFKLPMILAHQHLHQLPENMRNGVRANALTKVFFVADHVDGKSMADQMGKGVTVEHMQRLPSRTAMVRVAINESTSDAMTVKMADVPKPLGYGHELRRYSRETYGRDVAQVIAESEKRRTPTSGGGRFTDGKWF